MTEVKRCPTCGGVLGAAQPPLTALQAQLLRFVATAITRSGCAPSLSEICDTFNWRSEATAHEMLSQLDRKGYIRREPGIVRGITVLVPFDEIGAVPVQARHG